MLGASLVLLSAGTASGEFFQSDLPDLLGPNQFQGLMSQPAAYDFGQEFSAVEEVFIEVEATTTPTEYDECGTATEPQPCEHVVEWTGFGASLDLLESGQLIITESTLTGFNARDPHTATARFRIRDEHDLSFMFDGTGEILFGWNYPIGDPDLIVTNVVQPTALLTRAQLIVEGSPVPEPSAIPCAATAVLVLARLRYNRSDFPAGTCNSQPDGDKDGFGNPCDTDVNNNGGTDLLDVSLVLAPSALTQHSLGLLRVQDQASEFDRVLRSS